MFLSAHFFTRLAMPVMTRIPARITKIKFVNAM